MIDCYDFSMPVAGLTCAAMNALGQSGELADWELKNCVRRGANHERSHFFRFVHSGTGLVVTLFPQRLIAYVQFSPARVLRGNNRDLPTSDNELQCAIADARQLAAQVAVLNWDARHLKGLHCTLYIPVAPSQIIALFERRRHPAFKRLPSVFPGESLVYRGSRRRLTFYDKLRECGTRYSVRTRIEYQIRGTLALRKCFGDGVSGRLDDVRFTQAYDVLRSHLLEFKCMDICNVYSQDALVAWGMVNGWKGPLGMDILQWRLLGMKPECARKKAKEIAEMHQSYSKFDFGLFLPAEPTQSQLLQMTLGPSFESPSDSEAA